ncbi:uncharacterized protein LY89DRAFT_766135 [Mollisia scopiformis]|uniref:F-box domain-containing protein n=1 Tax=Mollisia scopiformis TaxID=149040 RepID=A0A132B6I9_MOLSC|nr:uncharacterized protein LY89DRAFT_766135 [Mollisia scopiformis]KUJ07504.1 hypothetical protein LY89DRAFT_766135 [Mollisia scopiformis]
MAEPNDCTVPSSFMEATGATNVAPNAATPARQQRLSLIDLPSDILILILEQVCQYSGTIKPLLQWGDSKFFLKGQSVANIRRANPQWRNIVPVALTAFNVALVCKTFKEFIDDGNLFYKLNIFEFDIYQTLVDYLKSLPRRRRQAVRHIKLICDPTQKFGSPCAMLSTLKDLRFLTLDITLLASYFVRSSQDYHILASLRGLKRLRLVYQENDDSDLLDTVLQLRGEDMTAGKKKLLRKEIEEVEVALNKQVKKTRRITVWSLLSLGDYDRALRKSSVKLGGTTHLRTILSRISAREAFDQSFPAPTNITWEPSDQDNENWPIDPAANTAWAPGGEWSQDSTPRGWFQSLLPPFRRYSG